MNSIQGNSKRRQRGINQDGFALILVIFAALILGIGAIMLSARSFNSLVRSGKQKQGDEARAYAEAGAAMLINELNRNFPYLLTANCQVENNADSEQFESPKCQGWSSFKFGEFGGPQAACSNRSGNPSEIMDLLYEPIDNGKGYYRLRNYEFLGDQLQGGTAIIQVEGQRISNSTGSSKISASAIVEKTITITPKCCNSSLFPQSLSDSFTTCSKSGPNFGLLTDDLSLTGGNVLDWIDANNPYANKVQPMTSNASVHCSLCKTEPEMNGAKQVWNKVQSKNSLIQGERSHGSEPNPDQFPAPRWNENAWGNLSRWNLQHVSGTSFTVSHNTHKQYCFTETRQPPITHCRMGTLLLASGTMIVAPINGEIRFYFDDPFASFEITNGNHIDIRGAFGQVAFFGYQTDVGLCSPQKFAFSGAGAVGPMFLHLPCALADLAPGTQVIGTAIVNNWDAEKNSNLLVPPNALEVMQTVYNLSSSTLQDSEEFAAVGTNRSTLIQR
jgi:hypothetical protein